MLQNAGPFSVFAPTDEAFARLTAEQLQTLAGNATLLRNVMELHVFPSKAYEIIVMPLIKIVKSHLWTIF